MKKNVIQYSIVQFMPYPDRQEGVNIGIVSYCPKKADFRFELLPETKKGRVNNFFKTLDKNMFKKVVLLVRDELNRLVFLSKQQRMGAMIFEELVRPRDSLVRYTDIRILMTDSYSECLSGLFDDLIAFESPIYKKNDDKILEKRFKGILKQHHAETLFKEAHLEKKDIGLSIAMPFFNEKSLKSIKPLSFIKQKDENSLIMHAANWTTKIEMLQQAELLNPKAHLVTFERPEPKFKAAFDFALERLDKIDVQVASIDDKRKIENFLNLH